MKKQVKDMWSTYNLLIKEREGKVKDIANAKTVDDAKEAVNSLKELDEHIAIVFTEANKLDPPKFTPKK